MELDELKVKAYDLLATIEQSQRLLQQVSQEIARKQLEPKKEEEKPKKKE